MFDQVARKIYRTLFRRGEDSKQADALKTSFDRLTKKRAPTGYGLREEYPELPKPFEHKAAAIEVTNHIALARLYTGQKIYVDTRDTSLAPHIMIDGVWEAPTTRAIATLLAEDDIFFDVGANFGYYSCIAATRLNKRPQAITIHAFEPNPQLTPLLTKTFNINGFEPYARINAVGVSDKAGHLDLHTPEALWGSTSFSKDHATVHSGKTTSVRVPVITLDDYYHEHKLPRVDLIKIDVEGFEDHVYAGMAHIIKANPQLRIVMEFTFDAYQDEARFFKQLGRDFRFMYIITDRGEFDIIDNLSTLRTKSQAELGMIVLTNKELL